MYSGSELKPNDAAIFLTASKKGCVVLTRNLVLILPGFGNMTVVNTRHRRSVYDDGELT